MGTARAAGEEGLRPEKVLPGYFFCGEDLFQAREFVRGLKAALAGPEGAGPEVERFDLAESGWPEVIDAARTAPFFFAPWRLVLVSAGPKDEDLPKASAAAVKAYFASPSEKTVLVVLYQGKPRKTKALFKLFSSLPRTSVSLREIVPPSREELFGWADAKLAGLGKRASSEVFERLFDLVGDDLERLGNELEKLASYAGDRRQVAIDDVNRIVEGAKSLLEWELAAALERADAARGLLVLDRLFRERTRPEYVLGCLAGFLRDLVLAKAGLRAKRDPREIYGELRPRLADRTGRFFTEKMKEFFALAERLAPRDLGRLVRDLAGIDRALKTSDSPAQPMFDAFVCAYARAASGRGKAISKGRG